MSTYDNPELKYSCFSELSLVSRSCLVLFTGLSNVTVSCIFSYDKGD